MSEAVGFSVVVKEISNSGKLIIGHNMLLDIMYITSQFMTELPEVGDYVIVIVKLGSHCTIFAAREPGWLLWELSFRLSG